PVARRIQPRRPVRSAASTMTVGETVASFTPFSALPYAAARVTLRVSFVAVVFLTYVFGDLPLGPRAIEPGSLERLGIGFRVSERDLVLERHRILAVQALGDAQRVAVRNAGEIQLRIAANIDRLDHQRVALPVPVGVAVERRGVRIRLCRWLNAQRHPPYRTVILIQEGDPPRRLQDLEGIGYDEQVRQAGRQAVRGVIVN